MANLFSYKNGDLATVMFKKRVDGIGWGPEMDRVLGKTGVVVGEYKQSNKITGYRLDIEGTTSDWIYPTECIQPAYPIKFKMGERVVIWRKPEDEELLRRTNWVGAMNRFVGKEGVISDIPDPDDISDNSYCVDIDSGPSYYFPMEALARPASIEQKAVIPHKPIWFLGEYSGKPYRSVSRDEHGYYTVEDEEGVQSYAKYMRIYEAPYDCKSFSYRVPQPQ